MKKFRAWAAKYAGEEAARLLKPGSGPQVSTLLFGGYEGVPGEREGEDGEKTSDRDMKSKGKGKGKSSKGSKGSRKKISIPRSREFNIDNDEGWVSPEELEAYATALQEARDEATEAEVALGFAVQRKDAARAAANAASAELEAAAAAAAAAAGASTKGKKGGRVKKKDAELEAEAKSAAAAERKARTAMNRAAAKVSRLLERGPPQPKRQRTLTITGMAMEPLAVTPAGAASTTSAVVAKVNV